MRLLRMLAAIGLVIATAGCSSDSDAPATSHSGGTITVEPVLARS